MFPAFVVSVGAEAASPDTLPAARLPVVWVARLTELWVAKVPRPDTSLADGCAELTTPALEIAVTNWCVTAV
jgi:hypothetical protein